MFPCNIVVSAVLVFVFFFVHGAEGAKILAVFPFPGPSQYILVQPYLKALAGRGHEVTSISAFPQKETVPNFRDISVEEIRAINDDLIASITSVTTEWSKLNFTSYYGETMVVNVLENANVQDLLRSGEKFDLIIIETLYNEALFAFAEHFGAHLIGVSTFGTMASIDDLVGNTSPISYVPLTTSSFSARMNYWQRLQNLMSGILEFVHIHTRHLPRQLALYRRYFPHASRDFHDVRKNFSLVLLNQHFSLSFSRPYVANMIEVGGLHLYQPRSSRNMPDDMQRFLDESGAEGVIYFSMGSNIQSKNLPPEKLAILVRTFASLKQRVLWKFEASDLPAKPDNVFISKWLSQIDVLAHPKVRLFITHGGLLSTMEAIYNAKPVLGIPMFFDQFMNMERAQQDGYGLHVDFKTLSVDGFRAKINEMLENPAYTNKAQQIALRYRDQPMTALDAAIYWTEYVVRHNGARHLRCPGQDLNAVQYHSVDTLLPLVVALVLSVWMMFSCLLRIIACLRRIIACQRSRTEEQRIRKEKEH